MVYDAVFYGYNVAIYNVHQVYELPIVPNKPNH